MPETNTPPQGTDPKTECELDGLLVKLLECMPDDIGVDMLRDHEVVKKLIKRDNPKLTDDQIEIMVEDPEEYEEVEEEVGKKEPKVRRRRKRKNPDKEPPRPPKDDGSPEKPNEEVKKKRKRYKSCYDEYQSFEKQYEINLDELTTRRAKLLSQRTSEQSIEETENAITPAQAVQLEIEKIDKEINDLQIKKINAEEKKNQCLKNLIDLPDQAPEQASDKSGGISIPDLEFACKTARDEIKKYNNHIRKLERLRNEVKKTNDSVKLQNINDEIQRVEKYKKDLKNEKCKKNGSTKLPSNISQSALDSGAGIVAKEANKFDFRSTDFPPFPKMKLGLGEIEQAAIDFGSPFPLKFPHILFKQAQELKVQIRICVSAIIKLFKDLVVDLVKLAIKLATGIPGAVILLSPPSFNIPGAISFVLFIVDAIGDIIRRVASAATHIPCLKKLNLVLPEVNFCNYVTIINVALKFLNALCLRLKKFDLLICKIIAKIIKKITQKKKSTIKGLEREKEKKQEELAKLQGDLNNASSEEAKVPIQEKIDNVKEEIADIDKRIEKTKNQQETATSSEQANMTKNLVGAAACLVPLLAILQKQDYSDPDPGETPPTDDLPPVEEFFEPIKEELDRVLTYVYDVMFEDGSMLYDVSQDYIDELRKLGYNVVLNF